jgi:hypothetical protein
MNKSDKIVDIKLPFDLAKVNTGSSPAKKRLKNGGIVSPGNVIKRRESQSPLVGMEPTRGKIETLWLTFVGRILYKYG